MPDTGLRARDKLMNEAHCLPQESMTWYKAQVLKKAQIQPGNLRDV